MNKLVKFSEIECNDLLNNSGSSRDVEIEEKMEVKLSSSRVISEKVIFSGTLTSGFEFLKIDGSLKYTLEMECSRCLKLVKKDCISSLGAIFTIDNEDEALSISDSLTINLEALVADKITDSMKIQYICSKDCMGLCSLCGDNKNLNDCGHSLNELKKNSKDNPFSLLNELDLKVE